MNEEERPVHRRAHEHAHIRLFVGIGALVVACLLVIVWFVWGDAIREACMDDEPCAADVAPGDGKHLFDDMDADAFVD